MIAKTHFKINLGLNIVNKLENGYHALETVFYPVYNQRDIIEIVPSDHFVFEMIGADFQVEPDKNLCVKAYKLLEQKFKIAPVYMSLKKNIPSGAGIGGGSGDAATTLLMLNELFQLSLSKEQLIGFASQLGSDVPFFILNEPCYATGVGNLMTPISLDLSAYSIEMHYSDIHVSTADAYSWITPQKPKISISEIIKMPVESWKELLVNDFEIEIFKRYPSLATQKSLLYERGAIYSAMSGSGSSIFGIFPKNE